MKSLLKVLDTGKILISDGAWGTLLQGRGLQPGECPELWNISHRTDVLSIARSYVDAGADIILTNSFGGSPSKLKHYELDDRTAEINQAAAAISREASGEKGFVLGSMGPTGVILMMGEVPEETLYEGFCIQAKALEKGGVDGLCIETMSALDEACLAVRAVKESTSLEIACTFTFERTVSGDFRTMMGVSPSEIVGALIEAGADIIGTNCGNGFDGMIDIVKEIRQIDSKIPVLVHANAGKPVVQDGKTVFPETPEMMAAKVDKLIHVGANIIGGCCGTTPDHIRALTKAIVH
ncbi:MAG: homocysteine S-methyltransferase family protein [Chitinispirillaceae bacterium]|nr:homocysteine S-methyltransferase family protein [Chitinispirillaceae bacterium]